MAKCMICKAKKGKRNCPALGEIICAQCCGVKKEKEIDCPGDCFYLGKSKQYLTGRQGLQQLSDFERQINSIKGNESGYEDILQNIEFIIHKLYKGHGNICDNDVEIALEYLMQMGKAQLDIPSKYLTELPPRIQTIVDGVNDILEFRKTFGLREDLITKLKCIHRVLDSVKTHYDSNDKYSYLKFIGSFLR